MILHTPHRGHVSIRYAPSIPQAISQPSERAKKTKKNQYTNVDQPNWNDSNSDSACWALGGSGVAGTGGGGDADELLHPRSTIPEDSHERERGKKNSAGRREPLTINN